MNLKDVADSILAIEKQLKTIREILEAEEPKIPKQSTERLAKGECVYCGEKLKKGERPVRGCHESCKKKVMAAVDRNEYTELEAIELGLIMPPKPPGRRPDKIVVTAVTSVGQTMVDLKSASRSEGKPPMAKE